MLPGLPAQPPNQDRKELPFRTRNNVARSQGQPLGRGTRVFGQDNNFERRALRLHEFDDLVDAKSFQPLAREHHSPGLRKSPGERVSVRHPF